MSPRQISKARKGTSAEHSAISWLLKKGYQVFKNVHFAGFIDIVIFNGKKLIGIDIKSESFRKKDKTLINRKLTRKQDKYGIELLFVKQDGDCYFGNNKTKNNKAQRENK